MTTTMLDQELLIADVDAELARLEEAWAIDPDEAEEGQVGWIIWYSKQQY